MSVVACDGTGRKGNFKKGPMSFSGPFPLWPGRTKASLRVYLSHEADSCILAFFLPALDLPVQGKTRFPTYTRPMKPVEEKPEVPFSETNRDTEPEWPGKVRRAGLRGTSLLRDRRATTTSAFPAPSQHVQVHSSH